MFAYTHPPGGVLAGGSIPVIRTRQGGHVVVDAAIARVWIAAQGRTAAEILSAASVEPALRGIEIETLGCLAEAQLIERGWRPPALAAPAPAVTQSTPVSAIAIVSSRRELEWIDECVASVLAQGYNPLEIIVIENGDAFDLHSHLPRRHVRIERLRKRCRLATAVNHAIAHSSGRYLLLLNPDVKLAPRALARLVQRAQSAADVAAVAPKTMFWRAPAFINGIGNRVGATNWGTDLGIGHLDLGQFDDWLDIPSASLTIMLVSRRALECVGLFDERFAAYYEDAEWSYRARLFGWRVLAAPHARAYHIFGGYWDSGVDGRLPLRKLSTAVSGRLRFAALLPEFRRCRGMLAIDAREDLPNFAAAFRSASFQTCLAYASGWTRFAAQSPEILRNRRAIQRRRQISDAVLFGDDSLAPPLLTYRNAPLLTSSAIREVYAPEIRSGRCRTIPERALADVC